MRKLTNDPMKSIGYMFGTELLPDNNQISKQIHDKYFTPGKKYEEQFDAMEKVFLFLKVTILIILTSNWVIWFYLDVIRWAVF